MSFLSVNYNEFKITLILFRSWVNSCATSVHSSFEISPRYCSCSHFCTEHTKDSHQQKAYHRCVIYARISMRTDHLIHCRQPSKTPRHTSGHYVVIILQWIVFCFVLKIILSSTARTEVDSQQGWSQLEILFKHQSVLITCVKCAQACIWGGTEAILFTAPGHIISIMAGKCILTAEEWRRNIGNEDKEHVSPLWILYETCLIIHRSGTALWREPNLTILSEQTNTFSDETQLAVLKYLSVCLCLSIKK